MKSRLTIFVLIFWNFCVSAFPNRTPETAEEALRMLDREVAGFGKYESQRQRYIDSLKLALTPSAESAFRIAEAYRKFNIDSALVNYRRAIDLSGTAGADSLATLSRLRYVSLLPASGYFAEAERIFDSINPESLSLPLKAEYFKAGNQLFFYASSSVSNKDRANAFARQAFAMTDSLLLYLPHGTTDYIFYNAERNITQGNPTMALADISEILSSLDETDERYGIAASMASYYYTLVDSLPDRRIIALSQAAISDIKGGRHEMTALQELGKLLYARGDLKRAERYMLLALNMTLKSGAAMRVVASAELMPVISQAAQDKANARTGILTALIILLVMALAVILWLLIRVYRSRNKLETARHNLAQSISVRDQHISTILNLCNECLNRLDDFNRIAQRKIKANQTSELYDMMQSRKIVRDQFAKFLERFDDTFLSIYPDFVEQLNSLLQPDKQYAHSAVRTLTPELRILAFIRLGIEDSGKIAKFLDLSVNTVYTYRNKIKNRALDRDNFETTIKNLSR